MIKLNKRDYKNPYTDYCYVKIYIKNRWKQQNVEENRGDLCISFFFFLKGGCCFFYNKNTYTIYLLSIKRNSLLSPKGKMGKMVAGRVGATKDG